MALNITIEQRPDPVYNAEVPEDVAQTLKEVYEALAALPKNRQATLDFATKEEVSTFIGQALTWCQGQSPALTFRRQARVPGGKITDNPLGVTFRIFLPKSAAEGETPAETPAA
jgi:hypothetical protein